MEEKKNTFKVVNDLGEEIECRILFTCDSEETKKSYIIYTDDTLNEEGLTNVYASIFDPTGKTEELSPIEDEKEWVLISELLEKLVKEDKEGVKNESEKEAE